MKTLLTKAVLGAALGASALTASAPAEAQRYGYGRGYGGWHHRGGDAGPAIVAGIAGLAVGAAIASSNRPRYVDRGYYYDRGYYDRGYYEQPYYNTYYYDAPRCRIERRYDNYGYPVRVRVCYR